MFYYISGKFVLAEANTVVIDAGGIGYKLTVSANTMAKAPVDNSTMTLYTYLSVKEDGVELFGFHDQDELSLFKLLISVSGVGPKAAISILSAFTPAKFAIAVGAQDAKALSKANGIGAKTAARIILELKDKVAKQISVDSDSGEIFDTAPDTSAISDAKNALMVLGYSRGETAKVLSSFNTSGMDTEEIIKEALKRMMK